MLCHLNICRTIFKLLQCIFANFRRIWNFQKKVYSPLVTFISGTPDRNNSAIVQAILYADPILPYVTFMFSTQSPKLAKSGQKMPKTTHRGLWVSFFWIFLATFCHFLTSCWKHKSSIWQWRTCIQNFSLIAWKTAKLSQVWIQGINVTRGE